MNFVNLDSVLSCCKKFLKVTSIRDAEEYNSTLVNKKKRKKKASEN